MANVLLVEDNESDEALSLRGLRQSPFVRAVDVARDGEEALRYLSDERTSAPAFILLDLKLPKLSGIEVLIQLRRSEKTRDCPVIVFTSSNQQLDIETSYRAGANSFVRKPVDFDGYLDLLGRVAEYWLSVNTPSAESSFRT